MFDFHMNSIDGINLLNISEVILGKRIKRAILPMIVHRRFIILMIK